MKKIICLLALSFTLPLAGFHAGIGMAWNSIDETFDSNLSINPTTGGRDRYESSMNRLAPVVQLGHRIPLCDNWLAGVLAQWKYLNYKTPNMGSNHGQILTNATFSSINIFGPDVDRDFTSKTRLSNEGMLLGYLGREMMRGYAYFGLGAVVYTASNSIYVSSVHVPNGVGNHLISTSVTNHKAVWGGAGQVGYQYCLNSNSFINLGYTYIQTASGSFSNSANAAILNGADAPGPTTLSLSRAIKFAVQELALSVNLGF